MLRPNATTSLAVGMHSITASYSGDSNFSAVTSKAQTVNINKVTPAVALTVTPSTATVGASISFASTVSGTGGTPTGTLTFLDGTTLRSVALSGGPATYATTTLVAGTHTITASYSGDATFATATSATSTVTINVPAAISFAATPTTLTVVHGSSGMVVITGTPVGGYTGAVGFACGTLPASASCSFAPAALTFSGINTAQSSTLTFSTVSATAHLEKSPLGKNLTGSFLPSCFSHSLRLAAIGAAC